jgi:hypothetical protein
VLAWNYFTTMDTELNSTQLDERYLIQGFRKSTILSSAVPVDLSALRSPVSI